MKGKPLIEVLFPEDAMAAKKPKRGRRPHLPADTKPRTIRMTDAEWRAVKEYLTKILRATPAKP